jgi:hypothetical protein
MNSQPKSPTSNHPRGQPREFEQIIHEKSHNFVGRDFVFTAIDEFIHRYNRGYFTIIGAPGSGKSAILAKYAIDHPHVVYYNAEVEGKNSVDEFLRVVCQQLSHWLHSLRTPPQPSPQGRREQEVEFLSLSGVLQEISEQLDANQKLIIAIDGLNCINRNSQPPGTNLFYLLYKTYTKLDFTFYFNGSMGAVIPQ